MPEIKHNFTKGRMNKDLDERLVPNGEYRDAMNIQITTSDGADVGTVQSLLGNQALSNHLPSGSTCVGSISDKKNDSIYWFVSGPLLGTDLFSLPDISIVRDYILRYKTSGGYWASSQPIDYVFTAEKAKVIKALSGLANINPVTSFIPVSSQAAAQAISVGEEISYILDDTGTQYPGGIVQSVSTIVPYGFTLDSFITGSTLANLLPQQPLLVFVFLRDSILNFHKNNLITGINIIDDLLLWCDGVDNDNLETRGTEPRKINITRSIQGTNPNGLVHTLLINEDRNITTITNVTPIRKEHITVIRKSPSLPPDLELISNRRSGDITGEFNFSFENTAITTGGTLITPGSAQAIIQITVDHYDSTLNWALDDILTVELKPDDIEDIIYPLRDSIVKLKITSAVPSATTSGSLSYQTVIDCEIISISPQTPVSSVDYLIDLQPEKDSIFKFKFPKFALRYKYIDNEYSVFSPWSQTAFIPETWDYQTKKGLNLGMQNNLLRVILNNILPVDMPADVVQVDILYKESDSPGVYLVDSIKEQDGTSNWANNEYIIHSELIHAILPENQLLRPWDNVPRKALAQEVTGNRVVYGNYIQNYSAPLENTKPDFSVSLNPHDIRQDGDSMSNYPPHLKNVTPLRSIKSLREYQFGVVYEDDYGRQSPVFTSDSGWLNIEKEEAGNTNVLEISINNTMPAWAKKFRFYVKDSSNEYYNLAMDRWFDAEDGGVWLSFPSLDRNKLTEESTLVLKKNTDLNNPITTKSEYKVIAIEDEVPPFVKSAKISYGIQAHTTTVPIFTQSPPTKDSTFVRYNNANVIAGFLGQAIEDWNGDTRYDKKMYVRFHKTTSPTDVSRYYEIVSMTDDQANPGEIVVAEKFGEDIEFIVDLSFQIVDGISMEISRDTNIDKSAYDGRFFVKILKDQDLMSSVLQYQFSGGVSIVAAPLINFLHYLGVYHQTSTSTNLDSSSRAASAYYNNPAWTYGSTTPFANNYAPYPKPFMPNALNVGWTGGQAQAPNALNETYNNFAFDRGGDYWEMTYQARDHTWFIDMEPTFSYPASTPVGYTPSNSSPQNKKNTPGCGAVVGSTRMDVSYVGIDYENGGAVNWVNPQNILIHQTFSSGGGKFRFNADPGRIVYTVLNCRRVESIINTYDDFTVFGGFNPSGPNGTNNWWSSNKGGLFRVRYELELDQPIGTTVQDMGIITPIGIPGIDDYDGTQDELGVSITAPTGSASYMTGNLQPVPVYHKSSTTYGSGKYGAFYDSGDRGSTQTQISRGGPQSAYNTAWGVGHLPTVIVTWKNVDGTNRIGFVPTQSAHSGFAVDDLSWGNTIDLSSNGTWAFCSRADTNITTPWGQSFRNEILMVESNTGTSFGIDKLDLSANPAIWETLPEKSVSLELYHEISQSYPIELGDFNSLLFAPFGSVVTELTTSVIPTGTTITDWTNSTVEIFNSGGVSLTSLQITTLTGNVIIFTRPDGSYTTATVNGGEIGTTGFTYLELDSDVSNSTYGLSWYNCFAFGNGVESNRISDTYNSVTIDKGVRVSAVLQDVYEEENRKHGLIYSGIYNSISGINNLNQFIQAEKITKDLNPTYGSIQRLFQRRISLIAFCEDRVIKILSNKDALYNADGNVNLVSTKNVLGEAQPFVGDFGISKNPESFATESYRAYFTDKQRGAVLRLSMDGLTPISEAGMSDWFKDNLRNYGSLIGSYDDRKKEYNLTLRY